jgi:DNA-binding transcriptional MerR regulator
LTRTGLQAGSITQERPGRHRRRSPPVARAQDISIWKENKALRLCASALKRVLRPASAALRSRHPTHPTHPACTSRSVRIYAVSQMAASYKIGQVASRLGISVRTLRHYDEIGLLKPAARASTGHRIYTEREVSRLQKIVALRKMGFSVPHIRSVLSGNTTEAFKTLEAQANRLRHQISQQQEVLKSVEAVLDFNNMHTTFTKEEIDAIKTRSRDLLAALRAEMEKGTDPKAPRVQELVYKIEHAGREIFDRTKLPERMETFKRHKDLMPQPGETQMDEIRAKVKSMRTLFDYLRRAKA